MPPTRLTVDPVSLEKKTSTEQRGEFEASNPLSSLFEPYILSHSKKFALIKRKNSHRRKWKEKKKKHKAIPHLHGNVVSDQHWPAITSSGRSEPLITSGQTGRKAKQISTIARSFNLSVKREHRCLRRTCENEWSSRAGRRRDYWKRALACRFLPQRWGDVIAVIRISIFLASVIQTALALPPNTILSEFGRWLDEEKIDLRKRATKENKARKQNTDRCGC